jgi:hypothetical protein
MTDLWFILISEISKHVNEFFFSQFAKSNSADWPPEFFYAWLFWLCEYLVETYPLKILRNGQIYLVDFSTFGIIDLHQFDLNIDQVGQMLTYRQNEDSFTKVC